MSWMFHITAVMSCRQLPPCTKAKEVADQKQKALDQAQKDEKNKKDESGDDDKADEKQ